MKKPGPPSAMDVKALVLRAGKLQELGESKAAWPPRPLPSVALRPHSDIGIIWLPYHAAG